MKTVLFRLFVAVGLVMVTGACAGHKPARVVIVDSDSDGIIDALDRCPDTEAGVKVDSEGCSDDEDRDGVFDRLDRCPGTPAGMLVDVNGCAVDTDGDGIVDTEDRCPETPPGVVVTENGCPRPAPAPVAPPPEEKTIASLELDLHFSTGTCRLLPGQEEELDRGRRFLQQHPGARVLVEGHTDSVGPAAYNRTLSRERAERVAWLLARDLGRDKTDFRVIGYGESRPVADNATQEGRERNRRVILRIIADN